MLGGRHKVSVIMKRFLLFLVLTIISGASFVSAKKVKISVTPSEAKIYVDGNYMADGILTTQVKKGFIVVKMECPGYITMETKIYDSDTRKAISYTLRKDTYLEKTTETDLANKYFTINVSPDLYVVKEDGTQDPSKAWKLIHEILLNYYEEIQSTDIASGFIQTPWKYKTFSDADKQVRTRVSIRQINVGGDLTFQVKISSEAASLLSQHRDESFQPIDRVSKDVEPLISELQSRVGRK